ncbi:class E sortase [Actinomadura macrotermitis]|uniref:Class E sortase n=1 Tax=Actinomadura macrotermitis TaxID=2585200 RepID=A0A7K0BR92_9ACTN|nr:class E sortase [Actinomadura macrotermitis]MQY03689.1 hypothetical protein [Actinomadura macrotermitis]
MAPFTRRAGAALVAALAFTVAPAPTAGADIVSDTTGDLATAFAPAPAPAAVPAKPAPLPARMGTLTLKRFHQREPIREGIAPQNLGSGAGHYPGTAVPGEPGNAVLLGHRTTDQAPFRNVPALRPGDVVTVQIGKARYDYRVVQKRITDPRNRTVLSPTPFRSDERRTGNYLTLITCHPKGSDRQRVVVVAKMQ